MVWTQDEYDSLKKAYLDLMLGKRVVEADLGGKQRVFQRGDANQMRLLLEEISSSLGIETACLRTYAKQGGRGA
jgi:hypothetical protein